MDSIPVINKPSDLCFILALKKKNICGYSIDIINGFVQKVYSIPVNPVDSWWYDSIKQSNLAGSNGATRFPIVKYMDYMVYYMVNDG